MESTGKVFSVTEMRITAQIVREEFQHQQCTTTLLSIESSLPAIIFNHLKLLAGNSGCVGHRRQYRLKAIEN